MIRKVLIRAFINPIGWRFVKGSRKFTYYRKLKKKQWESIGKSTAEQRKKLFELVEYTHKNTAYYREIIEKKRIKYSEETIFDDIRMLPVLTKEIIRKNFDRLVNRNVGRKYSENTSGGSTGVPIRLLQDNVYNDYMAAATTLFNEWAGRKEGDYMIKLWGSERDIIKGGQGINGFIASNIRNSEMLDTFRMSEEDMRRYISKINKKNPKIIVAYVQSAYEIAKFAKEKGIKITSPKAVLVSAGTLYPKFRMIIEEVFGCGVFNRYGSREVGNIACECEKHEGLHLNIFCNYFEILDEKLNPVTEEGKPGKIYVTMLNNLVMPLLRYDIGDIVEFTYTKCSCGRGMPLIKTVKGRDVDVFMNKKGERIDGEYFTHLFYFKEWVSKFQIVQTGKEAMEIKIVPANSKSIDECEKKEIEKKILLVMGKTCTINWSFVKDIPPSNSGKFMYTISKVRR